MFPSTYDCCGTTLQVYKLLQFRVGNLPKMTDSGAMCQPTSRIVNVVGVLSEVVGLFNSSKRKRLCSLSTEAVCFGEFPNLVQGSHVGRRNM